MNIKGLLVGMFSKLTRRKFCSDLAATSIVTATPIAVSAARKQMESYLNRTYMRQANPPIGVNPRLITWMSLG